MHRYLLLVVGFLSSASLSVAAEPKAPADPVEVFSDIAYYEGADADPVRHKLDIYVPTHTKDFPVLFFVHGGAWRHGHKNQLGIYAGLGKALAREGIGFVSTNYRLTPQVQHPEHIRDVARAFAWTHRNIAKYGGRPSELFVSGHSAGGHLSALLATDESYLKAEGLSLRAIRGAIPLSGVYVLPKHVAFTSVFGSDPQKLKQAAPVTHASAKAPPFLLIYADGDLPGCDRPVAQALYRALKQENGVVDIIEVARRNHLTIMLSAVYPTDPVHRAIRSFIVTNVVTGRVLDEGVRGLRVLPQLFGQVKS